MLIDPGADVLYGLPDAVQQALDGKLAVLVGDLLPPFDHAVPGVLDQAPQERGQTTEHGADGREQRVRNPAPVDLAQELGDLPPELVPVDAGDGFGNAVEEVDSKIGEALCQRGPIQIQQETRRGLNDDPELCG